MTIGWRIKKLRKDLGLTQQVFAEKIGATQNTITRYETDKMNPSTAAITLICRTFNVNETWLRTGKGNIFLPKNEEMILNAPDLDDFDRFLLNSYIRAPIELRHYIKQAIMEAAARYRQPDSEQIPIMFSPEQIAIYEMVKAEKEREEAWKKEAQEAGERAYYEALAKRRGNSLSGELAENKERA